MLFLDIVTDAWEKSRPASNLGLVVDSVEELMKNLRAWSKKMFGNVTRNIEKLQSELMCLQQGSVDREAIRIKMKELDELLYRKEMMWLQRS